MKLCPVTVAMLLLLAGCAARARADEAFPSTAHAWKKRIVLAPLSSSGAADLATLGWNLDDDPKLRELIIRATADNQDLRELFARRQVTHAGVRAVRAGLWPLRLINTRCVAARLTYRVGALKIGMSLRRCVMTLLFFAGRAMLLASVAVSASAAELDLEGLWKTPGETAVILRFTQLNGEYRGIIDSIPGAQGEDADLRCTECTGARRNQPLLNMEIVWGLKRQGREYAGGSVLDPETGAIYRCSLTIAPDGQQLRIRYSVEPLLKNMSEIWTRQTRPAAPTR